MVNWYCGWLVVGIGRCQSVKIYGQYILQIHPTSLQRWLNQSGCEIEVRNLCTKIGIFLGFNQQPPNPQEGYCNQIQDKIHPPNPRKVHGVITSRSSWWRCKDMLLMVPWAGMAVVSAVTAPVTCINRHARSNIARGYWAIQMFQKFLYEKLRGLFLPWLRKLQNVGKCSMSCRNFVFWCFLYFDIGEPRLHHLSLNVNVSSRYCKVRHADSFRNFRSWLVAQLHQIQCQ